MPELANANYHLMQTDAFAARPAPSLPESRRSVRFAEQTNVSIVGNANNMTITTTARQDGMNKTPQEVANPYDSDSPFLKLFGRISSLGELQDNWNSYGAARPNKTALFWARRVLEQLLRENFVPRAVKASPEEGVDILFISSGKQAAIECLNSGSIYFVSSDNAGEPQFQSIDPNQLKRAINELHVSFSASA